MENKICFKCGKKVHNEKLFLMMNNKKYYFHPDCLDINNDVLLLYSYIDIIKEEPKKKSNIIFQQSY